jgi:signal peptidase I
MVLEPLLGLLSMQFVRVRGDSMSPALRHGQWVCVDRRAYRRAAPQRGDIVRLKDPQRPGAWVVKRIVGLPGEAVRHEGGRLSVNGVAVPALEASPSEISAPQDWSPGTGEYVVLGDNRARSTDSRAYGPVRREAILGKVLMRGRLRRPLAP